MKTITREYNVYSFDELSEKAKDKAHSDYLSNGDYWFWGSEAEATMKEIQNLFHITLNDWEISTYRPSFPTIKWDAWWDEYTDEGEVVEKQYALHGNRARAFLWNNFGHVLTSPRYYGKKCLKHSRFFTDRVYEGTCPLTGVCFDNSALDPMAYFCFGVEWDEIQNKRVQSKRDAYHDSLVSVADVIEDCVNSMFKSFIDDVEYHESREYFEEECKANEWTFLENGKMFY